MALAEQRARNQKMAAYLLKSGYPHGKRHTHTLANPVPMLNDVGSAAYRRRLASGKKR